MKTTLKLAALILAAGVTALPYAASAQSAIKQPDPAVVEKYIQSTFGKAPQEWQDRIKPDETIATCNQYRNDVPAAEADKIMKRELAKVAYPADGKLLGDWKEGMKIAKSGHGGRFNDKPGTVSGGNCYACHQLDAKELSYGTIGPSLLHYGKDRKYDQEEIKRAYTKVYDAQALFACSQMPRFGANHVLTEQQIKDIVALLFDPESPVNK
jgi:sulfur-oxidizing protein SoxX